MANFGVAEIAMMTADLDDSKKAIFNTQYNGERKDPGTAVILALFLFDRFWLGDIGLGILKYITLGGCGIWTLIDLFTASGRCHDYNRRKAEEILQTIKLMSSN